MQQHSLVTVVAVDNAQELDADDEASIGSSISLLPLRVLPLARTIRTCRRELSAPSSSRGFSSRYYLVNMIAILKVEDLVDI